MKLTNDKVHSQCKNWADVIEIRRKQISVRLDTKEKATGMHINPPSVFQIWQTIHEYPLLLHAVLFLIGICIGVLIYPFF